MKEVSSSSWNKILMNVYVDIPTISRQVQNQIFKNRKESPLVFDWFYHLFRKSLENEMNFSVDQLVAQYTKANQ